MVLCTTPLTYVVVKSTVLCFKSKTVLRGPIREAGNLQIFLLLALTLQHFKILLHTLRYNFMKRKSFIALTTNGRSILNPVLVNPETTLCLWDRTGTEALVCHH